jgi:hypothetical protein
VSDIFGDEGAEFESEIAKAPPEPVVERVVESEPVAESAPVDTVTEIKREESSVPLAALNESRAQLRQTQAELAQMRAQMADFAKLKEEIDTFRARQQETQQEQEFNSDPLGVIQRQLRELDQKVGQRDRGVEQAGFGPQDQPIFQTIASQVQEFKKTAPDYDDALQHVLESRKQELMAMGANEYEASQRVGVEAQELATNALRAGQNPGQIVYNLAKLRGYAAKQAAAKLETVSRGQAASQSLSGASGGAEKVDLSMKEIDSMSDKEFDAWWAKNMSSKAH